MHVHASLHVHVLVHVSVSSPLHEHRSLLIPLLIPLRSKDPSLDPFRIVKLLLGSVLGHPIPSRIRFGSSDPFLDPSYK